MGPKKDPVASLAFVAFYGLPQTAWAVAKALVPWFRDVITMPTTVH